MSVLLLLAACDGTKIAVNDDTGATDDDTAGTTDDTSDDTGGTTTDTEDTRPPDYTVDCHGAGDFTTIQDAIDAAVSGQRIGIAPCTYDESIDFTGKSLDLFGMGDRGDVIIDGGGRTVVTAAHAESDGTRLASVTLTGGRSSEYGSAVTVSYAVLRLEDVAMTGNDSGAAVLYGINGFLTLADVHIADNSGTDAAVIADAGGLDLDRTDIDCAGGTYAVYQHDASLVTDSTLTCDRGYALYSYHGEVNLRRSRLTGAVGLYVEDYEGSTDERVYIWNSAVGGDQIGVQILNESVRMGNSVIWGTDSALSISGLDPDSYVYGSAFLGARCGIDSDSTAYDVRWNAFWDNRNDVCGASNSDSITSDPQFASFPDDLTLGSGSPLIDAGPDTASWNDGDGSRNDIGIYGGPAGGW